MLTASRESTNFTSSPFEECSCIMSERDSDDENAEFIDRIYDFVEDEKNFESSTDESESSSEYADSDGNSDGSPDGSQPEKRRRADDVHGSDDGPLFDANVDVPENFPGENTKLRSTDHDIGAGAYSSTNPVSPPEGGNLMEPKSVDFQMPDSNFEGPKSVVTNVPRRKPGPLRRRLKLMCKLNLDSINISAITERKNLGNCALLVGKNAGVVMTVNLSDETDDENYLLDEDKILDIFQDGDVGDATSVGSGRQSASATSRKDISRTSSRNEDIFCPIKKGLGGVQTMNEKHFKETDRCCAASMENLSGSSGCPVEVVKLSLSGKIVYGPLKPSTRKVSQERKSNNDSKCPNSLPKLSPKKAPHDERENLSITLEGDSDFVSKKASKDASKSPKPPKKTLQKKIDNSKKCENRPMNQKILLKGPKSRQDIFSPERKLTTGVTTTNAVKTPKESLFKVEKYAQKSAKSRTRIPLTQEAILARSQMNSIRLSLSATKRLPPKDVPNVVRYKTAIPVLKETDKTSQQPQQCLLSPMHDKPQSRLSETDENYPGLSCKTSQLNLRKISHQVAPKKELMMTNEKKRNYDKESGNKLFSRPVRSQRNDIPGRNISLESRLSSPLSDFSTRRNISAPHEDALKETNDLSKKTLAQLGLPNCEEPVNINWNHSNIPSVVNPEGMSGKLDPLVLSEASKPRTSADSSLSRRLCLVQIPSMNLSKDVLSEIDDALNTF